VPPQTAKPNRPYRPRKLMMTGLSKIIKTKKWVGFRFKTQNTKFMNENRYEFLYKDGA
jgi:hypothetical protein